MIKPKDIVYAIIENKIHETKVTRVNTMLLLNDKDEEISDSVVFVIFEGAEYGLDVSNVFKSKDELIKNLIKEIEWIE